MINLIENWDRPSLDLVRSLNIAHLNIPTVIINDNGFLPESIDSPVQFFCKLNSNHAPLYFDQITLPNRYWRIEGNAQNACVLDMTTKRADISYLHQDNSRIVKTVTWYDGQGKVAIIDHYNQHGFRFAQTLCQAGNPVLKRFYDRDGQVVITQHLPVGSIFLRYGATERHFPNISSFIVFYLKLRQYKLDHLLYNTLNFAQQVSLNLKDNGDDILFWHEKTGNELPGNMKFVMENKTRTKHVIFQRYNDWQRLKGTLGPDASQYVDFHYLGTIFPHPRVNHIRPNALIFTNSDQIVQLEELVKLLPNVHFTIAAITEMSDKLLAFQRYQNVTLYPEVNGDQIKKLIADNDIYLDINKGNEIVDAVRGAFEQNMLILGFKDTLHNPQFVAEQNVYQADQVRDMARKILSALVKPKLMKDLIDTQRREAGDVIDKDYQQMIGELTDD